MASCEQSPSPAIATQEKIREIALRQMKEAGVYGKLPTSLDTLILSAELELTTDLEASKATFLSRIASSARDSYSSVLQKLRGVADLRERIIFVEEAQAPPRVRFVKGHELGHQLIPWHCIDPGYLDDDITLGPEVKEQFEIEANFFSADVIFQGLAFLTRSRDYHANFQSIFHLAQAHEASRHATFRRFIESSDEAIAGIPFWPSKYSVDESGLPPLRRGKIVYSPKFGRRYGDINLADEIRSGHDWVAARDLALPCDGEVDIPLRASRVRFKWEAWWNNYCLLVLLRRAPMLSVIGRTFRKD